MSVTILDIMHLPSLQEARIVAGMNGINRSIASVSVLEAAAAKDLDIDLPGHATNYGQEIILTAFVAYRDSVDAQCEAIHALHKEGEAGIIIFYVGSILPSIDPRVIDLANELEMPIIVMPEGRLDLRYSDVICEIMEAIINDRRENSYFTTEVIERISHLGTSQRSINNAVAIIRDRVQCSIYLMDELGRMLNMAEWPNGRNLPADKFYTTLTNDTAQITGVQEVYIDGKTYLADIETIQSTGSILYMLVVKEKGSLTQESCKQIKYIIKTYINLWTENYGQLDTKQLVSSIINDEPEKMRHIANAIKINVDNLSCAYFFYLKDGSHEFICLQKMREIIKDFIGNTVATHQQSVGVDAKRRTGHQRYIVLAILDLQQRCVCGQYRVDGVYLVCQHLAQHMDVKRVVRRKLVNIRKQLAGCHATVGRQHRVGAAAAHRQGCADHMTHGTLQRVRVRATLHRQVYVDLGDVYIGHDAAHCELLGIRQGRGGCPSLGNGCRAGQHGVVLLRGFPLCSQFSFVGVFNGGGVGCLHIGVVLFAHQLADQWIEK